MPKSMDMARYRALLDVRDQAGAFASATTTPTIRRDAGMLYDAILKKDRDAILRLGRSYSASLAQGEDSADHPGQLARVEIATCAVRALVEIIATTQAGGEFDGMPTDLTTLSPSESEIVLMHYAALSVPELRKRREALREPMWSAWRRDDASALANLQVRDLLLTTAIRRRLAHETTAPPAIRGDDAVSAIAVFAAVAAIVAAVRRSRRRA